MHYQPKCAKNRHLSEEVCISSQCEVKNPFLCDKCSSDHKSSCKTIPYKKMIREFHKIQGLWKRQILKFEDRVEKTFDQLLQSLKQQFIRFREEFENTLITSEIKEVYQSIKSHKESELTGKQIASILNSKQMKGRELKIKDQIQMRMEKKEITQMFEVIKKKIRHYYSLKEQITEEDIMADEDNHLLLVEQKYFPKRRQFVGMIKNHFEFIEKFFEKEVYNVHPLYKASQNNFSAKIFHAKCDEISNTLTIAETQNGQIVIGFCPFAWKSPIQWEYINDSKKKSFLLSTSPNLKGRKFQVRKKKFAIGMQRDYGPCFGQDFIIYDKSNKSKGCWSNFPDVYDCLQSPVPHNTYTIKQFVGVEDHFQKFNIIEWEVYYISFGPDQQPQRSFMKEYRKIPQI